MATHSNPLGSSGNGLPPRLPNPPYRMLSAGDVHVQPELRLLVSGPRRLGIAAGLGISNYSWEMVAVTAE